MTIQRHFFSWANSGLPYDKDPWEQCSPNLIQLGRYFLSFGGQDLGCEGDRPIRAGTTISEHSWGAARDLRYEPPWLTNTTASAWESRELALEFVDWVIDWSVELHICRIHDYVGDRIWTAGRTANVDEAHTLWWKPQGGGGAMGDSWARYFHFVTTFDGWDDDTPIDARGIPLFNEPPPPPIPPIEPQEDEMKIYLARNPTNQYELRVGNGVDAVVYRSMEWAAFIAQWKASKRVFYHPLTDEPLDPTDGYGGIPVLEETHRDIFVGYPDYERTKADEG